MKKKKDSYSWDDQVVEVLDQVDESKEENQDISIKSNLTGKYTIKSGAANKSIIKKFWHGFTGLNA